VTRDNIKCLSEGLEDRVRRNTINDAKGEQNLLLKPVYHAGFEFQP
jgi:hypothetical protein